MVVPARVNYIRHLNIFFQKVRNDDRLHANHISLYIALFQVWNRHRFLNPFPVIRDEVLSLCRIGSYNTYTRCLKALHAFGYIVYQPASLRGLPSKISILYLVTERSASNAHQLSLFDDSKGTSRKSEPACINFDEWSINKIATGSSRIIETGPVSFLRPFINKQINSIKRERENTLSPNKKKRKAKSERPEANSGAAEISPRAPILSEVQEFFNSSGYPPAEALLFFHHYQANGWKQAGRTPIVDLQAQAHKWILKTPKKTLCIMTNENQGSNLDPEGSKPMRTKAIQTPYDYYKLFQDTEKRGKSMYGEKYAIQDIDRPVVSKLLSYFLQNKNIAESENIDLTKGIMLTGKVGCGKTALMKIMRSFIPESNKPGMGSCRDISFEFSQTGYEVIYKYSKNAFYPYSVIPRAYCFDDLGVETTGQFWGRDCNVMAEILLSRYDLFISHKMITHVTTNLNSQELEKAYGNRVRSRMREMFNLIAFNTETADKR